MRICRPVVVFTAAFIVGFLLGIYDAGHWMIPGGLAVMSVTFYLTYGHIRSQRVLLLAAFLCLLLGGWQGRQAFSEQREGYQEPVYEYEVYGIVTSVQERETGKSLLLKPRDASYRIQIMADINSDAAPGDGIRVQGILYPLEPPGNPGEYNFLLYYKTQGVEYQIKADELEVIMPRIHGLYAWRGSITGALSRMLEELLPEEQAGVVSAMLTGDRSGVDTELRELFQDSGIAHIIAISGLHIQILSQLLQGIMERFLNKRRTAVIILFILWGFCFLTGGSVSTVRACIMISFRQSARLLGRTNDEASALAAAAFCILLYRPLYIFDAGFQLSFGACLGLLYGTLLIRRLFWLPTRFRKWLMPSAAVTAATAPITAFHYYAFCPYAILLNMLVVPLMSIVVWMSCISLILYILCPGAAVWTMGSVYYILKLYKTLSTLVLTWPGSMVRMGQPGLIQLLLYYALGILWIRRYHQKPSARKQYRYIQWMLIAVMLMSIWNSHSQSSAVFLSVGQGDCMVICVSGKTYILDAGPSYEAVLKEYLLSLGIRRIDGIFLSHMDNDHCEGALQLLQDPDFQVECLYLPDHEVHTIDPVWLESGATVFYWGTGDCLLEQGIRMECLSPDPQQDYTDENGASMVLHIQLKYVTILMTGDIDQEAEAALLQEDLTSDILKVGHHGSRTSSSEAFLKKVSPDMAWISCGANNSYGHPHGEVLERLEKLEIEYAVSYETGALLVQNGQTVLYKEAYKRQWMD